VFRALTSYPEPTVGKGPVGPHCKWTRLPAAPIRGILCLLLAAHSVAAQASVSLEYRSKASFHRELLRDLLSIFKEHFPRHLQALREAVEHRDTKQARVVSHTLKGMLANLAVTRATATAAHLEQLASGGAEASLREALAAFERQVVGLLPGMETCMTEVQP
jgi:HPt (histidine-containing phosphotransfer) domain-containing protein